jgi:hypothetical protein
MYKTCYGQYRQDRTGHLSHIHRPPILNIHLNVILNAVGFRNESFSYSDISGFDWGVTKILNRGISPVARPTNRTARTHRHEDRYGSSGIRTNDPRRR